jgi:hypothetical protein
VSEQQITTSYAIGVLQRAGVVPAPSAPEPQLPGFKKSAKAIVGRGGTFTLTCDRDEDAGAYFVAFVDLVNALEEYTAADGETALAMALAAALEAEGS